MYNAAVKPKVTDCTETQCKWAAVRLLLMLLELIYMNNEKPPVIPDINL